MSESDERTLCEAVDGKEEGREGRAKGHLSQRHLLDGAYHVSAGQNARHEAIPSMESRAPEEEAYGSHAT